MSNLLAARYDKSYTFESMKIAVSIPDRLFKSAERAVKQSSVSRSEFYARALEYYLKQRNRDEITREANEYAARVETGLKSTEKRRRYKKLLELEW